ncbi:MAG: phospho-N-acetylmuramoyl-pentapeptide-transferase [Alphaproteobacteria bacterium]|nr:phospho-N-acetylmuramoyl-pentapeptide-transferase [Alphaproteobacteria bacterium]|tara:strand:- start:624 stop:1715 length:1092 start_codon:yes stop_codon:yes gene_type:complete
MLYNLLYPLAEEAGFLNLFQYLTFRSGGAVITALIVSFVFGPVLIRILKIKQGKGQPIRKDGPEGHLLSKQGTPTMGGVIILLALLSGTLLWADLTNSYVWAIIVITLGFGVIGFADDYLKVRHQTSNGVPARVKILLEIAIAVGAVLWIMSLSTSSEQEHGLALPFVKELLINLGWFFIPFAILVIVGASNAVNLTDGLDGLAIVPIMIAAACFGVISYFVGNAVFSNYLQLHYVPGTGELSVFCGALVGAGLGFLWFNAPPAMVFMGDTGSLAAGAALGAIAIMTKHELVLAIVGGLFVLETASVIVQVGSYKLFGRRVFQMAPLHHHFEKKGLAEPTIVIRFWIISVILALIGLATLKLR